MPTQQKMAIRKQNLNRTLAAGLVQAQFSMNVLTAGFKSKVYKSVHFVLPSG